MDIQAAYIRVFGAAAAALDELDKARVSSQPIENARNILKKAIEDTEEHTELK